MTCVRKLGCRRDPLTPGSSNAARSDHVAAQGVPERRRARGGQSTRRELSQSRKKKAPRNAISSHTGRRGRAQGDDLGGRGRDRAVSARAHTALALSLDASYYLRGVGTHTAKEKPTLEPRKSRQLSARETAVLQFVTAPLFPISKTQRESCGALRRVDGRVPAAQGFFAQPRPAGARPANVPSVCGIGVETQVRFCDHHGWGSDARSAVRGISGQSSSSKSETGNETERGPQLSLSLSIDSRRATVARERRRAFCTPLGARARPPGKREGDQHPPCRLQK